MTISWDTSKWAGNTPLTSAGLGVVQVAWPAYAQGQTLSPMQRRIYGGRLRGLGAGLGDIEPAPDPGIPFAPVSPAAQGALELRTGLQAAGVVVMWASLAVALGVGGWVLWKKASRRR